MSSLWNHFDVQAFAYGDDGDATTLQATAAAGKYPTELEGTNQPIDK
jgi:hypothetical protein